MNFPSWRPRKTHFQNDKKIKKSERKVLVISWWGFRWAYALWVMKALEEKGIKNQIDAIYWVSIWAIIWSCRSYGISAEEILKLITSISIRDFYWHDILKKSWGLVSNKKIYDLILQYLPKTFESLQIPFYAWCVDTNTATFQIFSEWELGRAVLWSMSIPGVFPPVKYKEFLLVDGGVLNNFPVDIAKKDFPDHKIIWIALNKFQMNQKITTAFDNLQVNFEVMMRSKLVENTQLVDYLFYRELPLSVLSLNKKQMHKAFALWYQDGIEMFG